MISTNLERKVSSQIRSVILGGFMKTRKEKYASVPKDSTPVKILKGVVIAFFMVVSVVVPAFMSYSFISARATADVVYKPSKVTTQQKIETLKAEGLDTKIGILLLGLDNDSERNIGSTRADSMIYVAYDGENKEMEMISLPRDIYTDIYDGEGNVITTGKINSAYAYNGLDATIETFQNYMQLPVDYYATVNFISFKQIIDAVGGVTVEVPYNINSKFESDNSGELLIPQGTQHLNGEQALIFARIRKVDDDIERGNRQQEVILATIKSMLEINSISKYQEILNVVEGNVETNLTFSNLTSLAGNMIYGFDMNSLKYEWSSEYVGQESVVNMNPDSYNEIRNQLLERLGLPSDYTHIPN